MIRKKLYADFGYAITPNYEGIVNWDEFPAREVVEDLLHQRGFGVFDVMEAEGLVIFEKEKHLNRLVDSMRILGFFGNSEMKNISAYKSLLGSIIRTVLRENKLKSSLIKIEVSRGCSEDDFHPSGPPNTFVYNRPFKTKRIDKNGISLMTLTHLREFPKAKTLNYCFPLSQDKKVKDAGFDDMLYTHEDNILECPTANFFGVCIDESGGIVLRTPCKNVLPGVTREIVIELAEKRSYSVIQDDFPSYYLNIIEGAFITSTTRLIQPIRKINGKVFYKNEITLGLRQDLLKYRRKYFKDHKND